MVNITVDADKVDAWYINESVFAVITDGRAGKLYHCFFDIIHTLRFHHAVRHHFVFMDKLGGFESGAFNKIGKKLG